MITGIRGIKCSCCKKKSSLDNIEETKNKEVENDDDNEGYKYGLFIKIIFASLVIIGQVHIIIQSILHFKTLNTYGKFGVIFGIILRFGALFRLIDINIYDSIFYVYKFWNTMKSTIGVSTYIILMIWYGLALIFLIFIRIYLYLDPAPNILRLTYSLNDTVWYRNRNNTNMTQYNIPTICDLSKTFDYAMLLTLPRLYEVDKDYTCRIKPHLRGIFNSTMKYIFGEDYSNQNIVIMCYPYTHNPYLVITSDTLTNHYFQEINTEGGVFLEKQFLPISNSSFPNELCKDGRASDSCKKLKECLNQNQNSNKCSNEWNTYSNDYWETFKDNPTKESLIGLEQYQYTLKYGTILQPRFIDKDKNYLNGPHIIIGGGFEDPWGYGYLSENVARTFIPTIFEQFIPLYGVITNYMKELFTALTDIALGVVYVETHSYQEMTNFNELITRFNFSHKSLLMVGHSISGSTIKEFSFVSSINGISFEATPSQQYAVLRLLSNYTKAKISTQNIANIYSTSILLSGNDDNFDINIKFPSHFYVPNIYDTACLVSVTCSETVKYQNLCNQVLDSERTKSTQMMKEINDAFYDRYL